MTFPPCYDGLHHTAEVRDERPTVSRPCKRTMRPEVAMLDKQTIRAIREQLAPEAAPVLSLYLNVNPAEPGNRQKASVLRARTALEGLDIPDGLRREILRRLDQEHVIPEGRTLVLFSGEDPKKLFRLEYLHEELPLLNLDASDGALAR